MGDNPRKLVLRVENNPVGPRRTARVDVARPQNGKLVVLARHGEVEVLVVVVLVRVVVDVVAGAVQLVADVLRRRHCRLGVAVAAAGVGAGTGGVMDWYDACEGQRREEGCHGEELGSSC